MAAVPGLDRQIKLQDAIATKLRERREAEGALEFDRVEVKPVVEGERVTDLQADRGNRARDIIENFMIAANGVTARFLSGRGFPLLRRVVRAPERWTRIAALAEQYSGRLPKEPDAGALAAFLKAQHDRSPETFPDVSLAVIKLLGRGEYVATGPGVTSGHFALAVTSYTHSTAPNRRFPDLVTQRQVKAALRGVRPAYDLEALDRLAQHCTEREDAANKVERLLKKAAAALWLADRIGSTFDAIVTGASPKGTWVRIAHPPVEGRLERGAAGLDVGDRVRVRLIGTNAERGFIDFERT
jgi:exoribonuclease-2